MGELLAWLWLVFSDIRLAAFSCFIVVLFCAHFPAHMLAYCDRARLYSGSMALDRSRVASAKFTTVSFKIYDYEICVLVYRGSGWLIYFLIDYQLVCTFVISFSFEDIFVSVCLVHAEDIIDGVSWVSQWRMGVSCQPRGYAGGHGARAWTVVPSYLFHFLCCFVSDNPKIREKLDRTSKYIPNPNQNLCETFENILRPHWQFLGFWANWSAFVDTKKLKTWIKKKANGTVMCGGLKIFYFYVLARNIIVCAAYTLNK